MDLSKVQRALGRYWKIRSYKPYARVLEQVRSRGDIWMVSQGEYMAWWDRRHRASLTVSVADGQCRASSDLEAAVFETVGRRFLNGDTAPCPESTFSGDLRFVIDSRLPRKHLLAEALCREGIKNFSFGQTGEFFLSNEFDEILEAMEGHLRGQQLVEYDHDIISVRDQIASMLAAHGLPLIRIWYQPKIDGTIMKAVFSSRHDVERALTNVPRIVRLEWENNTSSTFYIRVFQPFYTDEETKRLLSLPYSIEIALHAEFAAHAQQHGSEELAAQFDKAHLEKIIGRPVLGVSNHGGELFENYTPNYWGAVEGGGFLWTISQAAFPYYHPYRWLGEDGQLSRGYCLCYQFRDIGVPYKDFYHAFQEMATQHLDQALAHNGVMVLMFHPGFFGFFSYVLTPKNFLRLARFLPTYLQRALGKSTNEGAGPAVPPDLSKSGQTPSE